MKINGNEDAKSIIVELGRRIKQHRIELGMTQAELAEKCGVSSGTEARIEAGADTQLSNYLKVLSGLNLLHNIDVLIPEVQPNLKLLYYNERPRERVRQKKQEPVIGWKWKEDE